MARVDYSPSVTFTFTLSLNETEAETLRDMLGEMIHDGDIPGDEFLSAIIKGIHTELQENIEGAHRMSLVPRKPEHARQPIEPVNH